MAWPLWRNAWKPTDQTGTRTPSSSLIIMFFVPIEPQRDQITHQEELELADHSSFDQIGSLALRALAPKDGEVGAIYGLILVGSLMAAESYKQDSHLDVLLSAAITMVVYWLAHAYSLALGRRIERSQALSLRSLSHALRDSTSVLQGAAVPLLALLIGWAAGASSQTAIDIALWSTVGTLVGLELIAGIRAKQRPLELLLSCCIGAGIGAAVLALKALLH